MFSAIWLGFILFGLKVELSWSNKKPKPMKTKFTFLFALMILASQSFSQAYCTFTSAPYASYQPGITNFKMANINRNSANTEGGNALVITGQTITLTAGQTYSFSLTSTNDVNSGAPLTGAPQHVRIYIDFNKNGTFTDAGETAFSLDYATFTPTNAASQTYTNATGVTVPASVTPGNSKLRVTAKMGPAAGHTPPTPCNNPPDGLGYHGEMEDYDVVFQSSSSIADNSIQNLNASLYPNPFSNTAELNVTITQPSPVVIEVYNLLGAKVATLFNEELNPGSYKMNIDKDKFANGGSGIYFMQINAGNASHREKMIITE